MIVMETERLILRDNIESDLPELFELISDSTNMKYLPEIQVTTLKLAEENLRESIDEANKTPRQKYFFAVIDKQTNALIGSAGYTVEQTLGMEKLVNLGYFIKKEHWGKGYTTEACKEIVKYAFTRDNAAKVETGCLTENHASEKVMKKLGMSKEGELKKHQIHQNEWKDRVIYGLTKEEWYKT